jgi:hypothetical protein
VKRALIIVTALTGIVANVASATGTPSGGPIQLIATAGSNPVGTIVVAGAIGDYGKTLSMTKSGKPDSNGNYVKITLQKGTFEVNVTAFNKATAKAPATISDTATCSFAFIGSGPVTLFNGTGLYKGISGTLTITINFIGYGPLYTSGTKKGECNTSQNAQPLAQKGWIMGRGKVKFG